MKRLATRPAARRPLATLVALALASLFLAAPTPGNVGGCGSQSASTAIDVDAGRPPPGVSPMDLGRPAPSDEYAYFDRGLCASFCLRLRECGTLCRAMGSPPGCENDSND